MKFNVLARWGTTSAVQNVPGGKVRVAAVVSNEVDGISISRLAEVMAPASAFAWAADLHRARLSPPAPFSGAATWVEPRGNKTDWKGDLTVDFLGFPRYPLMLVRRSRGSNTATAMFSCLRSRRIRSDHASNESL